MAKRNYNIRRDPFTGRFSTEENAKALQLQFLNYAKEVKANLQKEYRAMAPEFVNSIDRSSVPIYTGNMHDSIGVGVIVNNHVRSWHGSGGWVNSETYIDDEGKKRRYRTKIGTTVKLTRKRRVYSQKRQKYVMLTFRQTWGSFKGAIQPGRGMAADFLEDVNKNISVSGRPTDVTCVLFAAMPYSQPINDGLGRGDVNAGWFNILAENFASQLEVGIKRAFINTSHIVSGVYKKNKYTPFQYQFDLRLRERLKWYGLIK